MVDYCTSAQVFAFLQLATTGGLGGTDFTTNTTPKKATVEEWIVEAEDEINQQTMNSWKTISVVDEIHTIKNPTRYYEGSQIFLEHRNITTFATPTDKLEVWNGSTDEDYLITRTEGRNSDYWVDEKLGVLWLRTYPRILSRTFDVKITYRFGEAAVPGDIRKACIRLAAIALIQSDDKSIVIPEGSQNIPLFEKTEIWQAQADKIIKSNTEIKNAIL